MGRTRRVHRTKHEGPYLYRRGRIYWVYLDREVRESLGTDDEAEARVRFAERVRRFESEGKGRGRPGEEALDVICEKYVAASEGWTRRTGRTTALRAVSFVEAMAALGVTYPSQITNVALDAWRKRRETEVARATINRDEGVARTMLAWAAARELCGATPLAERKQVKEPKRRPPPLIPSPTEVSQVVAALLSLDERGAALTIASALATGKRLDELRHLRPEAVHADGVDVVPEGGTAADAWTSKNHRQRRIPLAEGAVRAVRDFATWRTTAKGRKGKAVGLSDTWIAEKIDEGCAQCAVPPFRMHDLRRTFATECVRAGIPVTMVREWLGHRDVSTTERYLGRYRSDAGLVAPTPAALDVLRDALSNVVPIGKRKKGAT